VDLNLDREAFPRGVRRRRRPRDGQGDGGDPATVERGRVRHALGPAEVAASHASMVSQPEAVTRLILSAVEATPKAQ